MAAVMTGIDPHKSSHTAVAVGAAEEQLGKLRVRAAVEQAQQLLAWAAARPERTWAVEGARDMGHTLAGNSWPPRSGCWMSSPSPERGYGCRPRATRSWPLR